MLLAQIFCKILFEVSFIDKLIFLLIYSFLKKQQIKQIFLFIFIMLTVYKVGWKYWFGFK